MRAQSKAQGLLLDESLFRQGPILFPQLLAPLGGALRRLLLSNWKLQFTASSWVEVFTREVRPLTELIIYSADDDFPLLRILSSCPALKRLHLSIADSAPPRRLDCIADHVSQLTELVLEGVDRFEPVHHIFKRVPSLQHFSVLVAAEFVEVYPANKLFEGVARQDSRLLFLDMGRLPSFSHLFPCLKLCQYIRLRDFSFDTGDISVSLKPELVNLKATSPQISVHVSCLSYEVLPVMQKLGELLCE